MQGFAQTYFRDGAAVFSKLRDGRRAIFLFHGFPADTQKNEDFAQALASDSLDDVVLIHQAGLGAAKGVFSFERSLADAAEIVSAAVSKGRYDAVTLIGHSWGGYLAMYVAQKLDSNTYRQYC